MGKLDGHCLCGSISYTVANEEPIVVAICHCTDCRRQSAAPFSVVAVVALTDVEITGETKVFDTIGSDRQQPAHRHFCGDCGSPIMSVLADFDGIAFIKAGTLNDPTWLKPQAEGWVDSRLPWVDAVVHEDRGYFPRDINSQPPPPPPAAGPPTNT